MAINADKWPRRAREIAEAEFLAGRSARYVTEKLRADAYHIGALPISPSTVASWRRVWGQRSRIPQLPRDVESFVDRNENRLRLLHDMADYQAEKCRQRILKGTAGTDELERLTRIQAGLSKLGPAQTSPQPAATSEETEGDGASEFMQGLEKAAAKPRRRANKRPSHSNGARTHSAAKQNADTERREENDETMAVPSGVG